jgi:hypothetical protein
LFIEIVIVTLPILDLGGITIHIGAGMTHFWVGIDGAGETK